MKMKQKLSIFLCLLIMLNPFFNTANDLVKADQLYTENVLPVVFTEVYPNDKSNNQLDGAGENDLFELIEIYNTANQELNFNSQYKIRYDYVSNVKDLTVTGVDDPANLDVRIPANSPAVLWVERTSTKITGDAASLTEADFRSYHNIPAEVPVFKLRGQDGLNNVDRGFYITNKENEIISSVHYTSDDVADGLSYHTRVPKSGTAVDSFKKQGAPNAGVVEAEQLIATTNNEPALSHVPVESVQEGEDLTITATASDFDGDSLSVNLFYRDNSSSEYKQTIMTEAAGVYSHTIMATEITEQMVNYYLTVSDGKTTIQTEEFTTAIISSPPPEEPTVPEENTGAPNILITELTPNPSGDYRKGSGNQYEFMEVYNNSEEVLNLNGYTLFYLYPNNSPAPKKWTISKDTAIEPYTTAIIWFAKEAVTAGYTTAEDFNIHYNTTVAKDNIIFYDNKNASDFNLPNSLHRGLAISSSDSIDDLIVEAWYDPSKVGSPDRMVNDIRNSAVLFKYPESGKTMVRMNTRPFSNPGSIDEGQVPDVSGKDVVAPFIQHEQPFYQMQAGKNTKITITSSEELTKAELVYGTAEGELTNFTNIVQMSLKEQTNDQYVYEANLTISDLGTYRYMIITEDANGNVTKAPYNSRGNQITVIEDEIGTELPKLGLSLNDGDMVSGKVGVYAYGETALDALNISLNGKKLETTPALPGKSQLGFQAGGIDYIYQASASAKNPAGEREYFTRILPKYVDGAWYTYDMSPGYFISNQTVSIHSGGENVPYDLDVHEEHFNKTNFDDFEVINVHLVLPDGTTIKPVTVRNYLGSLQQTEMPYRENVLYPLGDGSAPTNTNFNKPMKSDFIFNIPEEKLTAKYAEMDSTTLADGVYELKLDRNSTTADTAKITIDNTDPIIEGISFADRKLVKNGEKLKGKLVFAAEAEDNLSGISKVEARLDGEAVAFPYETSSAKLAAGKHELNVTVYDGAGNSSTYSVEFLVDTETPELPGEVSPADFGEENSEDVTLKAKVTDPSGDKMDVGFYKGSKYDFARKEGIEGFGHIADREPPLTVESASETVLTEEDQAKIAYEDGEYLVNDSNMGFPYHRFEVSVEEELTAGDTVELYWKGKTLPNRKVTLYAWDHNAGKWVALKSDTGNASESDMVLTAKVDNEKFIKEGKIQAMVQDEVKNANDPFTMLWMTDTQYYAETYHHIWDGLGDWIVDEYKKDSFEYVIHSGDLVNVANDDAQWTVADRNLQKLDDADVPYGVLAGNHDSIIDGVDYSYYHKWVGEERYKNNPWYGGSMDNNRNHYDLMSFGGHDFIIVYLGFGLEDTPETIAWANEALQKHSDRNAILVMHAYLEYSATLSKMSQNVFDQIIVPNENVKMVMGGHYHGVATRVSEIPNQDGSTRKVLEMLADYQGGPNGGDGYIRYLKFNPIDESVSVETYSPILNDNNFFDEPGVDTFTSEYQLMDINKRVATDYFSVNVYSDQLIGKDNGVKSGEIASTEWTGLQPNETHYWYMNVSDEYGATRKSDIFRFSTGHFEPSTGNEPGNGEDVPGPGDNGNGSGDDSGNGNSGNSSSENSSSDDSSNTVNENSENQDDSPTGSLPNTATSIFNWLVTGIVLLLVGFGILIARRKEV